MIDLPPGLHEIALVFEGWHFGAHGVEPLPAGGYSLRATWAVPSWFMPLQLEHGSVDGVLVKQIYARGKRDRPSPTRELMTHADPVPLADVFGVGPLIYAADIEIALVLTEPAGFTLTMLRKVRFD